MICEHCGGNRVVSYPPPACGCPGCGAPVCCQTCCDAHSHGYNREGNLSESTSIPSETDTKGDKSMTDPNAIPKMQAFATMEQMADLRSQLANAKHLREIITPHDNDCAFMQGGRMACNCNGTRWFGYAHRDTVDVLGVWALCNWFAALAASEARCAELTAERDKLVDIGWTVTADIVSLRSELARVKALEASMRETLTGIANASPKVFDCPYEDFADEFLGWARSRARNEIARPNLEQKT